MSQGQASTARAVVAIVWLLLAASFFMAPSGLRTAAQLLFWILLISHAIECMIYWPTLRATGKPMAGHIVQTILFGYIHYQAVKRNAENRPM